MCLKSAGMGPKRRQLTFREKSRIIQEVEENPDLRKGEIARRFNIPPSTLSTILKNKRAILASERTPAPPKNHRC